MISTMIISGKIALSTKAVNEGAKLPSSSVTANTNETWKLSYFHHDHLGNITAVTDEHGNLLEIKDYLPFGGTNVHEIYGDYQSDYAYNDKEKDDESNLYYYGARYYNDSTSKFTSIDPALFNEKYLNSILDDPQKLNSYSYARNNPINYVDKNGEEPNKAQVATLDQILERVQSLEQENPNADYKEILNLMAADYQTVDNEANKRYLYTEEAGWIDMKHFFAAGNKSFQYDSILALLGGLGIEIEQLLKRSESAFSYEDLPSNYQGVAFAELLKNLERQDIDNLNVSDLLKVFLDNLKSTDPINAPNYDELPDSEDGDQGSSVTQYDSNPSNSSDSSNSSSSSKKDDKKSSVSSS